MTVNVWRDVEVDMQSAAATAVTIADITNANPAHVTHSGTDPSDGDYVLITAVGMNEVTKRLFKVSGQAAGSFDLNGEDSTTYNDFVSGTFQVITFGTSFGTITQVSQSGGEYDFIDSTTIHDRIQTQVPGTASPISYSLTNRWEPGDTALAALKAASIGKTEKAFKFTFASGNISVMYGYVGYTGAAGGTDLVTSPATITASNVPTDYAS